MNTWLFYRRIRGPVFLLTFGVTALLWEWHVLSFGRSWPLYLIVAGVLRLAEGAALAVGTPPVGAYGATGYGMAQPPVGGASTEAGAMYEAPGTAMTTTGITGTGITTSGSTGTGRTGTELGPELSTGFGPEKESH